VQRAQRGQHRFLGEVLERHLHRKAEHVVDVFFAQLQRQNFVGEAAAVKSGSLVYRATSDSWAAVGLLTNLEV
jgi:hypothetical protein